MAAPASAAATAASAISFGVIGRYGDIDGVWIAPVTAQVMMTLRDALILVSPSSNLVPMLNLVRILNPARMPNPFRMPYAGATQATADRASACGRRALSRPADRRARRPLWQRWLPPTRRAARRPPRDGGRIHHSARSNSRHRTERCAQSLLSAQ